MQVDTSVADANADSDTARSPLVPVPGLVWAFRIHSDGVPEMLAVDQPIPFSRDGLLWLHFNLADARALQWLTSANFHVPAQARALLLSKDTYQQLHTVDDCVYGVISDLLRDVGEATDNNARAEDRDGSAPRNSSHLQITGKSFQGSDGEDRWDE